MMHHDTGRRWGKGAARQAQLPNPLPSKTKPLERKRKHDATSHSSKRAKKITRERRCQRLYLFYNKYIIYKYSVFLINIYCFNFRGTRNAFFKEIPTDQGTEKHQTLTLEKSSKKHADYKKTRL